MAELEKVRDFFLNEKIYMHCTQHDDEEIDGLVTTTVNSIEMAFFKKNYSFELIKNTLSAKIGTSKKGVIMVRELRGKAFCKETQKEVRFVLMWESKTSSLVGFNFIMNKDYIISLFSFHVMHSSNCFIRNSGISKLPRSEDELDAILAGLSSVEKEGMKLFYSLIFRAELSRGHESQPNNPDLFTLHLYCLPLFFEKHRNFEAVLLSLYGYRNRKIFEDDELIYPTEWVRVETDDEYDYPYYQLLINPEFVKKNNYFLNLFYIDVELA